MYRVNGTTVAIGESITKLNLKQITIFKALAKASPAVVSSDKMLELAGVFTKSTFNQHISTLRLKLRDFEGVKILTHNKIGYSIEFADSEQRNPKSGEWWKVECASGYCTCLFFFGGAWADAELDGNTFDVHSMNPIHRMVKG